MRTGLLWCTQSRTQQCDTRGYAQLEEVHDTYQRMVGRPLGVPQFLGIGILYILVVLLVTTWFPMYISLLLCDGVQPFRGRTMWYPIHPICICMHCTRKTHIPSSTKVRERVLSRTGVVLQVVVLHRTLVVLACLTIVLCCLTLGCVGL